MLTQKEESNWVNMPKNKGTYESCCEEGESGLKAGECSLMMYSDTSRYEMYCWLVNACLICLPLPKTLFTRVNYYNPTLSSNPISLFINMRTQQCSSQLLLRKQVNWSSILDSFILSFILQVGNFNYDWSEIWT